MVICLFLDLYFTLLRKTVGDNFVVVARFCFVLPLNFELPPDMLVFPRLFFLSLGFFLS